MSNLLLCPSIMNLDVRDLSLEIAKINDSNVDILHLDLMDGTFVPNFGMSLREIAAVRKLTSKPIDCHLMIMRPSRYLKAISELGVNIAYIHPESELIPSETLNQIKTLGMKPGLVVNPCTSLASIEDLLPLCEYVMMMGVNPGFAGRDFMDYLYPKFKRFADYREQTGLDFKLLLDGGATLDIMSRLYSQYAFDGFVLGKQEFFFQKRSYLESAELIRQKLKRS